MNNPILPGQVLQHFKGGMYKVLHVVKDAETQEPVVVYCALKDGGLWTRALSRFSEQVKWPDGVTRTRFLILVGV